MSLANGRELLAIPGPSVMPDRVLAAMHRASPNIYAGALIEMVAGLIPDLRAVAGTQANVAMYIGNGHATWEAANANLFSPGDHVLVLISGVFGQGWANAAEARGVQVERLDCGRSGGFPPQMLAERLARDGEGRIKAVLTTHVDTSTSARTDIAGLRAVLDRLGHPALLAVDCIASLACDRFEMDAWGVDVALAASQKGLMVPPGLGFVWFSENARAVGQDAALRTPYWDWTPRADGTEFWQLWHGTAPTHHLFGLREALTMILHEEGLPQVWARHECLARTVWAAFDGWGQGAPGIGMIIPDAAERSWAVTSARIASPDATRLRGWCEAKAGLTLGIGLGMAPQGSPEADGFLRLGHMGHVNAHMVLGTLAVMEAGMQALSIPHGAGALDRAAAVVAGA
jgi:alanine-glyoxylate transaminase/serine-glyoxylate transaminase/serine-pyruvate transaminase